MITWVLVADRGRARILAPDSNSNLLVEIEGFVHTESRLREQDTVTDGPGHFSGGGAARHAGEPEKDFKHDTAEKFAQELASHLEKKRQKKEFDKLAVVAPPLLLGVLRKKFPTNLTNSVVAEINKDLSQYTPEQVQDQLPEKLFR